MIAQYFDAIADCPSQALWILQGDILDCANPSSARIAA
jgi:hypothetical protein